MARALEEWSKDELIAALRALQERSAATSEASAEATLHELRVYQIELEMQNRELREAQQLLEESRSRYADLYDLAPLGYCTLDAHGIVREANLEAAQLLGTERAHLTDRPLTSIVATDLRLFRAHLDACLSKRERVTSELTLKLPAGSTIVVQMVSTPLAGGGDAADACLTTLTEITEHKRSEERLRMLSQVSERLASSLDYRVTLPAVVNLMMPTLADIAFVDICNLDHHIERFMGDGVDNVRDFDRTPQAEVLRSRRPLVVHGAREIAMSSVLGRSARTEPAIQGVSQGSLLLVPLIVRGRGLGVFTFMMGRSGRAHSNADQQLAQEVAARTAMAVESARLYETAQLAIRAREDIVAVVSHELRNPLHGMRLNCDHLLETSQRPDRRSNRKQLEAIARGIARMNHMIGDLSDFARIEAGHLLLDRKAQPLAALVGDALDVVRPLAARKRLVLHEPRVVPEVALDCDRDRMLQVLSNLLGNAIKFTPERGEIAIDVSLDHDFVRFTISDNGPGIERDQLGHIFERYWRANERGRVGTGLGLFIAKSIVDGHGGQIGAESDVGHGTMVWFTMPTTRAVDSAPGAEALASLDTKPPLAPILVVDDDQEIREAISDILASRGYLAETAANGDEALRYLQSGARRPCLILLDLKMPVMDGWTMHARLRGDASLSTLPVLLVSDDANVERHATSTGASGCVRKPIDVTKLLAAVQHHCCEE